MIPISTFINRIVQLGLKNLTKLQFACLSISLGKPSHDYALLYSELELYMTNFGVPDFYDSSVAGSSKNHWQVKSNVMDSDENGRTSSKQFEYDLGDSQISPSELG